MHEYTYAVGRIAHSRCECVYKRTGEQFAQKSSICNIWHPGFFEREKEISKSACKKHASRVRIMTICKFLLNPLLVWWWYVDIYKRYMKMRAAVKRQQQRQQQRQHPAYNNDWSPHATRRALIHVFHKVAGKFSLWQTFMNLSLVVNSA